MKKIELKNIIAINGKYYLISTISMKIRHKFFEKDNNLLVYETMVFEIKNDNEVLYSKPLYNERYVTSDEAIAEHGAIVQDPTRLFLNQKCKVD
ncbi:MAG: hypothetical protein LBL65_05850 [Campylobacteraceae bacterium]|jgi:hypothetical protein|nr:hypothetical protein [Campylobacteraceae bacterium]